MYNYEMSRTQRQNMKEDKKGNKPKKTTKGPVKKESALTEHGRL